MNLRLTIKLWNKYRKEHKKRVQEHEAKGELNYESSDDEKEELKAPVASKAKPKIVIPQVTVSQVAPAEWLTPRASKNLSPNRKESWVKVNKLLEPKK